MQNTYVQELSKSKTTHIRYVFGLLSSQLLEVFKHIYSVSAKGAQHLDVATTKAACIALLKPKSECRDQNFTLRIRSDSGILRT